MALICFPHAGGSAGVYRPLAAAAAGVLPAEVFGVQYPGRQDRADEPVPETLHELADQIAGVLEHWQPGRALAFLGHSMGAVVAFETACRLAATRPLAALLVSGRPAPSRIRETFAHRLDDDALAEEIIRLGGTAAEVLEHPEMRALILPLVRADYRLSETYRHRPGPALACPVTVLTGDDDPLTPIEDAIAWRDHTSGPYRFLVLPGGHFFLFDHLPTAVRALARAHIHRSMMETTRTLEAGPEAVIAARVGGVLRDLAHVPAAGESVERVAIDSEDGRSILRHSCAHILAQAVQELFPEAKPGIGPPIRDGFYYDFAVDQPFRPADLERIEKRMRRIIAARQRFARRPVTEEQARDELAAEPFKLELIGLKSEQLGESSAEVAPGELTIYDNLNSRTGQRCWKDLCKGPHLPDTGAVPAFRLTRSAAAYWRGDEKRPQLQRIYGTAWESQEALERHLELQAEAERRDHRRIGEDLDLFAFSKEVGKGLPLWLPNGTVLRDELEGWARETERELGYQRVVTPHITREDLYYLSGHLPYYRDDLYAPIEIEGENYYLKPMNCPHHHMVYQARPHSYRELPYKIAEYGTVYRFERSGQLYGTMRTRGFTQNDAHIYCTEEQAKEQFLEVMRMHDRYYRGLGITDFYMVLALRDPANKDKYHDDTAMWETAERITREAMEESAIPFIDEPGGAAHYGPKVDFIIRSVTGREFAASTNQVDLYTPQRFGLTYKAPDGTDRPVVVIHRAPLGSHERFVSYLTEHFAGAFPFWLAPEQIKVIPIVDEVGDYAEHVRRTLFAAGFRAQADHSDNRLGAKVRAAVARKIPYILVVGRREAETGTVSVRDRAGSEESMSLEAFQAMAERLTADKSLEGAGHLRRSQQ